MLHAPQFVQHFDMPIELSLRSPAHSFSQTLPDRATSPHPTSASPGATFPKKHDDDGVDDDDEDDE